MTARPHNTNRNPHRTQARHHLRRVHPKIR